MKRKEIQKEVRTMEGKRPQSDHAVRNPVARLEIVARPAQDDDKDDGDE